MSCFSSADESAHYGFSVCMLLTQYREQLDWPREGVAELGTGDATAIADVHLQVVKADDGSVTRSGVVVLDDAARVVELSRMMAGHDSGLARGHAEELLAAAEKDRALR